MFLTEDRRNSATAPSLSPFPIRFGKIDGVHPFLPSGAFYGEFPAALRLMSRASPYLDRTLCLCSTGIPHTRTSRRHGVTKRKKSDMSIPFCSV